MATPILRFAHICDSAFLSQDNKLNIIGVFDKLYASKFPFTYPKLTVVSNVTIFEGKTPFQIRMLKQGQKEPFLQVDGEITSQEEREFNLIADFPNIPFSDQREYEIEIWFGGTLLTTLKFTVGLLVKAEKTS